jgi:hypothetical protein
MTRPITNRSNYWSQHHHAMLIVLAKQVLYHFRRLGIRNLEMRELINVGWYRQARYWKSAKGKAAYIKREMLNWVYKEMERQPLSFESVMADEDNEGLVVDKRNFRVDQKVWITRGKR